MLDHLKPNRCPRWLGQSPAAPALCCVLLSCGFVQGDDHNVVRYDQPRLILRNAGFELGLVEWKPLTEKLAGFDLQPDSLSAVEGQRCLKIDLSRARTFGEGRFRLASPWITLPGGGNFELTAQIKADAPGRKAALRVLNGVAKMAMRQGKQSRARFAGEEACSTEWTRLTFNGTLPAAEKDSYRIVIELEAPGVYWIDQIEFRHGSKNICAAPELEAGLQPADIKMKLHAAPAQAPVQLWVVNRTAEARKLKLHIRQTSRLSDEAKTTDVPINVAANASLHATLQIALPHADDYRLAWSLHDESGRQVDAGALRLAAHNAALPLASGGEAVWGMHLNTTNMDITLPLLRQTHITYLRNIWQIYWNQVQPKPDKWLWPDDLLAYLHEQGFQVLPILGFPPRWASVPAKLGGTNLQNKMPRSWDEYHEYLQSIVARYGKQITRWEIWNEPNLPRYFEGTAEEYGQVLAASVNAIKTLQPQATVVGLSLAWTAKNYETFMKSSLTPAETQPQAISFHPYEKFAPEQALAEKIENLSTDFHELKNYTPELWATETGYGGRDSINNAIPYYSPPRPATVDEMTQAEYLARHALLAKSAGVKYYFCYSMDSERPSGGADVHGLLDYDWNASVKPALLAYATLAQLCGDATFEAREDAGDPAVYLLHFRRADGRRFSALWKTPGDAAIALPTSLRGADAWDFFGNRLDPGKKLPVGARPVYFLK